jgi:hypothetical protein
MKTNVVRLCLLFVLLSVTPQTPASLAAGATGQNANSSTTVIETTPSKATRCATKCRVAFGRCTRRPGDVRRKCLISYRNCLRRCPRPKDVE